MKLTKTATKLKPGMTLIEITVVILVLLTLISVLFIGANIYKKGADRAACILNIRNIHQAVRADQNLTNKAVGDLLTATDIFGAGKYLETTPDCPADGGVYAMSANYPAIGTVVCTCGTNGAAGTAVGSNQDHFPADVGGW